MLSSLLPLALTALLVGGIALAILYLPVSPSSGCPCCRPVPPDPELDELVAHCEASWDRLRSDDL